jgi:hypothetical protein
MASWGREYYSSIADISMEVGKHQMEEPELGRYWGQRLVREVQ